jgi:hypothetical protein
MNEQIVATIIRDDETVSFSLTEPFYRTCIHVFFSLGLCIRTTTKLLC